MRPTLQSEYHNNMMLSMLARRDRGKWRLLPSAPGCDAIAAPPVRGHSHCAGKPSQILINAFRTPPRSAFRSSSKVAIDAARTRPRWWGTSPPRAGPQGGNLSDAMPAEKRGTFDACIAGQIIEHTPDLVGFPKRSKLC
jgi:hypothetical protein